ncbi:MAG: tryptophan--tRNA ligase [Holosporaceae bacterium]|jgi:tryptophanyl-tRNA synthetase|nr:tryptophan--tRNA ligase [Holosporaceae bacterium]
MKKVALTGDRPTGNLHLGHLAGSLMNRVQLQDSFDQYVMLADVQALTDYFENPQKVKDNILEVAADYLAVGIDPELSTIFIQSQIPQLAELTVYFMNLVTVSRLERNPTVKTEIAQKEFGRSVPTGFLCYPISQAADITAFGTDVVPVGEDQLPMIELANEIVRKFNRLYQTDCLKESEALLGKTTRLVGIDGKAKASKSLNNAIFLNDPPEIIKQKVQAMYTDPDHIRISDPGKVDGNVVFAYLDAFYDNAEEISSLKQQYSNGGLGDTALKSLLNECLQKMLLPIREKRRFLRKKDILEICINGTRKAKSVAAGTLAAVKSALGINFFNEMPMQGENLY